MRIGLFITCTNDLLYPGTGVAVTQILERLGHTVEFPPPRPAVGSCTSTPGTAVRRGRRPSIPPRSSTTTAAGATVHWATDAPEACRIVTEQVRATGADSVVKVKSMATQEIGLNEALAAESITAHETDLAELIVQLNDDTPSHILVPAIHYNRTHFHVAADFGRGSCG